MKTSSGFGLVVAAAGAIANVPVEAGPVTLSHSVALNTLLQQGSSTTLSFDIGSFLAGQGFSVDEVIGGTVSVFGFSEASYAPAQAAPYGDYNVRNDASGTHLAYYTYYAYASYRCGWSYCGYSYPVTGSYTVQDYMSTADRDILHNDAVADRMQVTVGNTSANDTASTQSASTGNFGAYIYDGTINAGCSTCSQTSLYHRERDLYSAVFGDLGVALTLDAAALLDLQGDGQLQVGLAAPVGQFSVNSISFDLLAQRLAPTSASASDASSSATSVPEPASLGLTALALAAALAVGRRRRARRD